jgi:hypothetical protein
MIVSNQRKWFIGATMCRPTMLAFYSEGLHEIPLDALR